MLKFLLELHDAVFATLQFNGLASDLGLKLCNPLHRIVELTLTFALLGLPCHGDLFDSFNLALFKPSLKLLFLGSFPQFKLPNSLIL